MYFNREQRRIFLAHPRTGSHAVAEYLVEHAGFEKAVRPDGRHAHHARLYDAGCPILNWERRDWSVATTIRDHWTAARSWVNWDTGRFTINGRRTDVTNIREDHLVRAFDHAKAYVQGHRMYGLHVSAADTILTYDALESDLARWLDVPRVRLPWTNVSTSHPALTPTAADYIFERFNEEIHTLGYENWRPHATS